MPFWFVKWSVSPVCSVPDEIVTVAPVRSAEVEAYRHARVDCTAAWPTVKVLVMPDGVTTGPVEVTVNVNGRASCRASALMSEWATRSMVPVKPAAGVSLTVAVFEAPGVIVTVTFAGHR